MKENGNHGGTEAQRKAGGNGCVLMSEVQWQCVITRRPEADVVISF